MWKSGVGIARHVAAIIIFTDSSSLICSVETTTTAPIKAASAMRAAACVLRALLWLASVSGVKSAARRRQAEARQTWNSNKCK